MRFSPSHLSLVCVLWTLVPGITAAQHDHHSDVRFQYLDGQVVVEAGPEGLAMESEFELDGVNRQFTIMPGFNSEVEEGLGIHRWGYDCL